MENVANPVIVADYDPQWPQPFEVLRSQLASVLNEHAMTIEHVGSTAVPGLAGKPIIDIDVLLRSSTDLPVVIRKVVELGYEHKGNLGGTGREAFRVKSAAVKHHLYVCWPGSREFDSHVKFRHYLIQQRRTPLF